MRLLFLFFDGIGLGDDDPTDNPFAVANMPTLHSFTEGKHWLRGIDTYTSERGIFLPLDACLSVEGRPQSATGQATIMTGLNVPQMIGRHYGPKPTPDIALIVREHSFVKTLAEKGLQSALVNAYPPPFFRAVERGKRLHSSYQMALVAGGVEFPDHEALLRGEALSADFTGYGWKHQLGYEDAPLYTPQEAGGKLAELAEKQPLTFVDHWVTDYVGHRGTLDEGIALLESIDGVIEGLLHNWDDDQGLIVLTSDHGNLESIKARGHTRNAVPTLLIGAGREQVAKGLTDLAGIAPAIVELMTR